MSDERSPDDDSTRLTGVGANDETRFTGVGSARSAATALHPDASIPPGSLLGHTYRIDAMLARGGMGEVYRARHAELDTEHAIKIILPELANDQRIVDLFRREASILRTIRHDAVVAYDGVFRDENGRLYLVMEFVDGPSLSKLMRERTFSADEIRQLRDRLADGLAVAHEKGVIHRDLSPDNVILPGGEVTQAKIIDFGISKLAGPETKTIIGTDFAGKFSYVSPEQLGMFGGEIDGRSDIYSLGLVLAAAAQGEPLDMGLSPISVIEARRSVPDLSRVPEGVRADLAVMLQPDPAGRPNSMRDLVRDAEWQQRPDSTRAGDAVARRAATGTVHRIGAVPIMSGLAVLMVLAGGAWYWFQSGSDTREGTGTASQSTGEVVQQADGPVTPSDSQAQVASGSDAVQDTSASPTVPGEADQAGTAPATDGQFTDGIVSAEPPSDVGNVVVIDVVQADPPTAVGHTGTSTIDGQPPTVSAADGSVSPGAVAAIDSATAVPDAGGRSDTASTSTLPQTTGSDSAASQTAAQLPGTQTALLPVAPDVDRLRADAQRAVQGLSCAGVDIDVSATGDVSASGYVGSQMDRAKVGDLLAAVPNVGRVDNAIATMPSPLCETLNVLRERTSFNVGQPGAPSIDPGGIDGVYREGDHLLIGVTAPSSSDGYLYVDYIDAAERYVVHLLPNDIRNGNRVRSGEQVVIGTLPKEVEKYTVSPPFGSNLLIVVASREPLFTGIRPHVEEVDSYLPALRQALDRVGTDGVSAAYRSVVFKSR